MDQNVFYFSDNVPEILGFFFQNRDLHIPGDVQIDVK